MFAGPRGPIARVRLRLVSLAFVLTVMLVAGVGTAHAARPVGGLVDGPIDGLIDPLTGEKASLSTDDGVVHLVFFATWCPDCLLELEGLAELEARWSAPQYRLVLVAVAQRQNVERLQRFASEHKPPGRLLFDADAALAHRLGLNDLPSHFVFDSNDPENDDLERFEGVESASAWLAARFETARNRGARRGSP